MKTLHTIYTSFAKRAAIIFTLLLTLGVTSVWAQEEELVYTLDGTLKEGSNGYDTESTITQSDISWSITGNTQMAPWRIGGKSLSNADRALYSKAAITDDISKIVITHGSSSGGITVNSMKVIVSTTQNGGGTVISTLTPTFKANGDVTITRPDGKNWSNAFYKIVYNVTVSSSSSNNYLQFSSAKFYKTSAPACSYTVTFNGNGNTGGSMSAQKFNCGEAQALTANAFTKTGHTFAGWNTEVNGSGASYSNQQSVSNLADNGETITLFAQWTAKTSTISFDQNGGEGGQTASVTATYGQNMPTPITLPTRYGHTFGGYYDGEGGTGTQYYTAEGTSAKTWNKTSASATLYAKWTEKDLTNYRTSCAAPCEQLGDATELSVQTDYVENGQTYVKFSWTPADNTRSHATKQVICIGKVGEEKKCTDLLNNQNWSGDLRSKLTPGEYEWTIQAIGDGETYCDGEVISGPNFIIEEPLTDNCRWVEIALEDITPEDEIVVTMGNDEIGYALGTEKITNSPKSQAITITSGMIDINQDFDYSKYTWSISAVTGGYTLQPYGTTDTYLYGVTSYISIGNNTNNIFTIFTSPENGNKCFAYVIGSNAYFLGYGKESNQDAWKQLTSYKSLLASNTLKFYKKTCLPANKFWIDYELANVTCTNTPPHSQIDQTSEDLLLEFSANDGYKLPESISVSVGNNILPEDNDVYIWDSENGELFISAAQVTDNITISISGCEQLAAPLNLSATQITSTSAVLSWDAVANADEYIVFVTDGETNLEIPTTNCTITIEGLSKNTYYLWDVTATADNYCDSKKPSVLTNEFTTLDVYTVTFNTNGGTAVASQTVDHGGKAAKPTDPTKTGYKFAGWYTEADTEFNFNTPIESATTLYAKWNANQYTITFRQQWGNGGTETATVHFDNNDFSVSPIIVPTRNGYTFGGYYTAESGAGTQLIDVSGAWLNAPTYIEGGKWVYADNLTLYAKWTQNFTITWMANGQLYHTQTAMMGTAIAKPDDPKANELACDDKVFVGWLDETISGSTNEEPTFVTDFGTIQANETYYAVFAKLTGTPSNDYNKITDINDLTDGEYVIAYGYNTTSPSIILTAETRNETTLVATSATPTNNKYTSPAAANIWEIKKTGTTYTLFNAATSQYIQATNNPTLELSNSNPTEFQISYSTDHWKIKLNDATTYQLVGYTNSSGNYFQTKSGASNSYKVQLYKNASTAVYSDYVTTCVEIPTPHWEGAEIDNANIAVDCGAISFKSNASKITFDKNYDLTYSITLTASEGFLLSTNKQNDIYEQSVTVTPVQSGDNKGKITQPVYVRADATGKKTNFDGTITISGDQLAEDQIIEVHAVVDCPQYTLTFNDCGDPKTITDFAGTSVEEMEPWAETCSEPFLYVFDGWATAPVTNGTEEYEKVDFSTYTMPNNNTTILYAVYRYAEEGGEPVNGYVKVTEALTDWSGDYVIVNETAKKAIKSEYKTNTTSNKTLMAEDVTLNNNMVVSPSEDVIWQIRKNGNYYTMYNETAEKYAYITQDKSEAAGLDDNSQNLSISFNNGIVKIYGETITRCFSYYSTNTEWRTYSTQTYSTGALYRLAEKTIRYTSSLVCGSIEAEDAIVTSTVGQIVKVNVPITLNYSEAASITGTSDNEAFTVVTKNDVAVGESNIEVHYKPTAYVNTANQEETATITLTTSNGATTTFNVTGRCLPETFAIVAKVGNVWYALPSQGLNSETTPVGYPVEVDNNDNPTAVTSLPTKAEWALRNVYKVNGPYDRFAANGENLVFVNAENKTLYANNGNANIQTYAEYTNYAENNPDRYEWVPTTTDLTNYTLKNVGRDKNLSINVNATFGTHASNIASNNLRFLPINATYNPFDMQVVEWYPTKVLVQTEAALTSVSATVGGVAVASPVVTKKGGKLYEISGLPLENNPTKVLTISYDSYSCSKVIPIIISRATKSVTDAPFSTLTTSAYNYSDLVVRDGATLTINGTKQAPDKFVNVTIYPTAKIVVPENKQLSVYSLTFFGGIDDIYDGEKYTTNKYGVPQFSLKGTLGKTVTTMDYIMRVNTDQMYSLGVPYDVALEDIKYWDGSAIGLGTQLYVSAYDGQARANREKKTWIYETDFKNKLGSATLKAGVGYTISAEPQVDGDTYSILRMPIKNNINSGATEGEKKVNVVAYDNQKGMTITDNHKGWNLVGNPYMTTITGADDADLVLGYLQETGSGPWEWVEKTYRYVTIPADNGKDYSQQKFTEAVLPPFKNFFVQIGTTGELAFGLGTRQSMPARSTQAAIEKEVEFEILMSNDARQDNTGLLISEEYSPAYEINADLEKMIGSMSVYTIYGGYKLAYNALSPINASEWIPMGYIAPAAGEYTFRLDDIDKIVEQVEHVYLIDYEANNIVDLMDDEYEFTTDKEQNNNRFAINIVLIQDKDNTTTGMDIINGNVAAPIKFIYHDKMYIQSGGVIYDGTGKQVTNINK